MALLVVLHPLRDLSFLKNKTGHRRQVGHPRKYRGYTRRRTVRCKIECPAWMFLSLQDRGSSQIMQSLLEEIFASGLEFRKPGQTRKVEGQWGLVTVAPFEPLHPWPADECVVFAPSALIWPNYLL